MEGSPRQASPGLVWDRKRRRLPNHDYSQNGAYYITVVARAREQLFIDEELRSVVEDALRWLATRYGYVRLNEYAVMPNHLHAVLWIERTYITGRNSSKGTTSRKTLGSLIGAFKTVSTQEINRHRNTPHQKIWQLNYHERVVRSDEELNRIREYIIDNPLKWNEDPENPAVSVDDAALPRERLRTGPVD
jgi:putative transposase